MKLEPDRAAAAARLEKALAVLRMGAEMHRALAVRALSEGESLNTFVVKSLKKSVQQKSG